MSLKFISYNVRVRCIVVFMKTTFDLNFRSIPSFKTYSMDTHNIEKMKTVLKQVLIVVCLLVNIWFKIFFFLLIKTEKSSSLFSYKHLSKTFTILHSVWTLNIYPRFFNIIYLAPPSPRFLSRVSFSFYFWKFNYFWRFIYFRFIKEPSKQC